MEKELLENHQRYIERIKLFTQYGYNIDKEREFVLNQAKPISGKILDAGTGKGHFALVLAKAGYKFVAFDIAQEELRFAKLNLKYYGFEKDVDFRIEDAENTTFADAGFDVIFSINTLHHMQNPYKVINELIRILSQNGKLILSDFTEEGFSVIDKIHALEGKKHETGKATLSDIESCLLKKGFTVKKSKSIHQYVLVAGKELV